MAANKDSLWRLSAALGGVGGAFSQAKQNKIANERADKAQALQELYGKMAQSRFSREEQMMARANAMEKFQMQSALTADKMAADARKRGIADARREDFQKDAGARVWMTLPDSDKKLIGEDWGRALGAPQVVKNAYPSPAGPDRQTQGPMQLGGASAPVMSSQNNPNELSNQNLAQYYKVLFGR